MISKSIYCTYLTTYFGSKLPLFYIGSTSMSEIIKGYQGSVLSKKYMAIWKSELELHPELFKTKILRTFETRQEAYDSEEKLQRFYKVVPSNMFINEAYANKGFSTSGKTHSKETKIKQSIANKGVPLSKDRKDKISKTLTGTHLSEIRKLNLSKVLKGKPQIIVECPHCGKIGGKSLMGRHHFNNCKELLPPTPKILAD